MRTAKLIIVSLLLLMLPACATGFYRSASSGQMGCPEDEVDVGSVSSSLRSQNWEATCRGHKFYCTSVSSMGFGSNQVSCKEELVGMK